MTQPTSDSPSSVQLDDLLIDLEHQAVFRGGVSIDLPDLSFRLLACLIEHAPKAVSKDELIASVWGNTIVSDETLAQRVRLLRQSLDEPSQNPRYIMAVRGKGYRLLVPVTSPGHEPMDKPTGVRGRVWLGLGAAGVLVALVLTTVMNRPALEPDSAVTLAVLPFDDMSADKKHQYFADGMQEELLARLAQIDDLSVVSRTSVAPFANSGLSIREIAKRIGAQHLIEGSIRVANETVVITVQLIDGQQDQHLWAETYQRALSVENLFSIQREVASEVAKELSVTDQTPALESAELPTQNLAAYQSYLLGRYHTFRQTPDDLNIAVQFLTDATQTDPQFAEAFAALGWAHSFLGTVYGSKPPGEVYPAAKQAALRALAIDPDLADARTLYADILTWYDWDFETAEREYEKTLALDPNNSLGYALFLSTQQRHEEALQLIEQRLRVTPEDAYVRVNAAWRFLNAEQFQRAHEEAELGSSHTDALSVQGHIWLAEKDYSSAVEVFEQDLQRYPNQAQQISNLAYAYFMNQQSEKGHRLLHRLNQRAESQYVPPILRALPYLAAGNTDKAFELLQESVNVKERGVIFLAISPALADYREDPRFVNLTRQVGLLSR